MITEEQAINYILENPDIARRMSLNNQQMIVYRAIKGHGDLITVREITMKTGVSHTQVNKILVVLHRKGYVIRTEGFLECRARGWRAASGIKK